MKRKIKLFSIFILISTFTLYGQTNKYYLNYSETLSKTKDLKDIYKYAFMPIEFIEQIKNDSSLIENNIFKRENYKRTKGEEYYYDVSINFLKYNLLRVMNESNQNYIKWIFSHFKTEENPKKPNVDWGIIFETCQTCYFGSYPADRFAYFNFSLVFMGENEIKKMISYDKGEQWKYAIMAIKGGDSFTIKKNSKYGDDILDRRVANYIVERWENSKIPEIQELVTTYKNVMALNY